MAANRAADRLARLEQQMAAVLERLEAQKTLPAAAPADAPTEESSPDQAPIEGTLLFSGSIRRGQQRFRMQHQGTLSEALEADPELVARVFGALASPFRVRLLRALMDGPRTSQELQATLDVGPVGQLYHHLKELLAAGLVVQRKRSVYTLREEIVMPICMAFVVAPRLASSGGNAAQATHGGDEAQL